MESPAITTVTVAGDTDRCAGSSELGYGRAALAIQLYLFPLVIVAGCLLNVLAVVVLHTRAYRGTSMGFLMTALSLADTGLLLTGILRYWILAVTDGGSHDSALDVRDLSAAGCKLHIFLTYVFQYISAWTLAILTVERAICVRQPLRCKELCSLRRVVIVWLLVVAVVIAVNAQFLASYDLSTGVPRPHCHGLPYFVKFLYHGAHNGIDLLFACVGPFVVIVVCNLTIVATLLKDAAVRRTLSAGTSSSPAAGPQRLSSTTVMLLAVSTTFLVLMCPFAVFSLGVSFEYWPDNNKYDCARQDFVYYFTYLLFNLNSAVNFLLYYVSGTRFRKAMIAFVTSLRCGSKENPRINTTSYANPSSSYVTQGNRIRLRVP